MEITINPFAATVRQQLERQGFVLPRETVRQLQEDADAINRLYYRGFIVERTRDKLCKKLCREITKATRGRVPITGTPPPPAPLEKNGK